MLDVPSENLPQKTRGTIVLRSISHTLAYADVFDYPLTAREIFRYLTIPETSFEEVAQVLVDDSRFAMVGEYFILPGREHIVETRKRRARIAARLWKKAALYGRIIARMPFVRMVAVTGSLAMNNTDEGNDIDYMIVTAPGRLWSCRALSLLIARFAKLEGVNLCPNYLVTTAAMALKERSLYVAHELAQMIPLSGREVYDEMLRLNAWMTDYLPNALISPEMPNGMGFREKPSRIQRILEGLFRLPFANWFEQWEMKRKMERLTREQSSSYESYFSAEVCKGHVDRHGQKIEHVLMNKLRNLPHSTPLPKEEGTVWQRIPPLPVGEGRGEGE